MKINIEIDVTPAELRHFLGLPDVAGLQEDMIDYVRTRVSRGADNFDPAELLRETTDWGNKTLQRILGMAASRLYTEEEDDADTGKRQGKAGSSGTRRTGSRRKSGGQSSGGKD
ncbi:hypothetical protein RM531_05770 [Salinisphaera sp. P385]|uniref:Uncharacterized protein n=1 Tax=Spectribacter acetivorans TaxID=3075603 RepID=A0ABU3B724_9GAMM|nr:hypothetical protein [Salinisphaera sp. P385]MDT0617973.1 hypothetical protein [Salinisphaera sp. P385]